MKRKKEEDCLKLIECTECENLNWVGVKKKRSTDTGQSGKKKSLMKIAADRRGFNATLMSFPCSLFCEKSPKSTKTNKFNRAVKIYWDD